MPNFVKSISLCISNDNKSQFSDSSFQQHLEIFCIILFQFSCNNTVFFCCWKLFLAIFKTLIILYWSITVSGTISNFSHWMKLDISFYNFSFFCLYCWQFDSLGQSTLFLQVKFVIQAQMVLFSFLQQQSKLCSRSSNYGNFYLFIFKFSDFNI